MKVRESEVCFWMYRGRVRLEDSGWLPLERGNAPVCANGQGRYSVYQSGSTFFPDTRNIFLLSAAP